MPRIAWHKLKIVSPQRYSFLLPVAQSKNILAGYLKSFRNRLCPPNLHTDIQKLPPTHRRYIALCMCLKGRLLRRAVFNHDMPTIWNVRDALKRPRIQLNLNSNDSCILRQLEVARKNPSIIV